MPVRGVREGIDGAWRSSTPERIGACDRQQAHQAGYRNGVLHALSVEEALRRCAFHAIKTACRRCASSADYWALTTAFLMETWIAVYRIRWTFAGRSHVQWPAFIIPAYEWTILFSAVSGVRNARRSEWPSPQLYHPVVQRGPNSPRRRHHGQVLPSAWKQQDPKFSEHHGHTRVSGTVLAGIGGGV